MALWTGAIDGPIPDRERAGGIIAAGIKRFALSRPLVNQISPAVLGGAFDA